MSSNLYRSQPDGLDYLLWAGTGLFFASNLLLLINWLVPVILLGELPYSEFPATVTSKDLNGGYINGANHYLSVKSDRLPNGGALVDVDEPTYVKAVVGESVCVKFKSAESVIKIRLFSFSKDVGLGGIGLAAKDIKVSREGGC